MSEDKPKVRDDLTITEVENELLVLNDSSNQVHQLNSTASLVFKCCNGSMSVAEIGQQLAQTYQIDAATAQTDVEQVLSSFQDLELLTP